MPALPADDLTNDPTDVWLTNGGTLSNQRYSPLDAIDTSNVKDLKGVWMTNLESGTAAKYSAEGQPIFYNGMLYVPTGEDDVFAVDVDTGAIRWKYDSGISQEIDPGGTGEGVGHAGEATTGNAVAGQQVFAENCSGCHGLSGHGANGGPTLVGKTDRDAVLAQVQDGGGGMPAFKGSLTEQQIQDVVSYVTEKVAPG
ncbi:MAG TPA: c-type cytochrome [Gaiella sp.]